MPSIIPVEGDITRVDADAIVNAANTSLHGGAGVNGAVHAAGGPVILEQTRTWYPHGLGTGDAAWTTAGGLPARWVIHTVGPNHHAGQRDRALLASSYRRSLEVADGLGARTVAFPVLSSGIFGWPFHDAVRTAVDSIGLARTDVRRAYLVAHGDRAFEAVQLALQVSTPLRLLQGLRHLFRRGYHQLRFLPGMSPSGMQWRIAITTADNLRNGDPDSFHDPRDEERVLYYSTADEAVVGEREVTAWTTPAEAAAVILERVGSRGPEHEPSQYARWFGSLLAEVERATYEDGQGLPVAYADDRDERQGWELGWGSGRRHPAPPSA
ncbi:MAG: macro domain-containing protein [Micrococcus sp.]|nr:macro domain-containing protein [Micrococcus sp.]